MADMENIHKEITIPNRIFLKGFEFSTEEDDLQNIFAKYGSIRETKIIRDARTGQSKGFGFITFDSQQVTEKVLETCKSVELSGVEITVGPAKIRRRPPKYLRTEYNNFVNSQCPPPATMCAVSPDGLFTMFYPTIPILPPYTPIHSNSIGVSPIISSPPASISGKFENHILSRTSNQQLVGDYQIPLPDAGLPQIGKIKIQDETSVPFHNGYCELPALATNTPDGINQQMLNTGSMVSHTSSCQSNTSTQMSAELFVDGRRTSPTFHDHITLAKGHFHGALNGLINCGRNNNLQETASLRSIFHAPSHRAIPNGVVPSTYGSASIPVIQETISGPVNGHLATTIPGPVNGHLATINGHVTTVNSHPTSCAEANLNLNHLSTKAVHTSEHAGLFKPQAMQYIPLPLFQTDCSKEHCDAKGQDLRIVNSNGNGKEHFHSKIGDNTVANVEFKASKSWKNESYVFMTAGPGKVKRVVVR